MLTDAAAQAISAVLPANPLRDALRIRGDAIEAGDVCDVFNLPARDLAVIALGKAGGSMAQAARALLGDRIAAGIAVVRDAPESPVEGFELVVGGHPEPDETSVRACERIEAFTQENAARARPFLILLSGGASSLVAAPEADLTLGDLRAANRWLLESGHNIRMVNLIRRKITRLGGGGLALRIGRLPNLTLAISDVVHGAPEDIGSGPTLPDPAGESVALRVITEKGKPAPGFPDAVWRRLAEADRTGRSLKPDRNQPVFQNARFEILGDNRMAVGVFQQALIHSGCARVQHGGLIAGEARDFGRRIGRTVSALVPRRGAEEFPFGLVYGGESAVTLEGPYGTGGRNMELALALAREAGTLAFPYAVLSFGTDGSDGSGMAAGALVDSTTLDRAARAGLDPGAFLDAHDAHPFFERLGDLFATGPTGTNVADLIGVVVGAPAAEKTGQVL